MFARNPSLFIILFVIYEFHGQLNRLEGFEVVPVAFFLIVDPLACGLYDGRDVLLAIFNFLWFSKANFFLHLLWFYFSLLTFALLCLHFRLNSFYFFAGDGFNGHQGHP